MKRLLSAVGTLCALTFLAGPAAALDYTGNGYELGAIRPGGDRPCTLFQLAGVAQADASIAPGSPWFTVEATTPGYKEMVATLLLAKATGRRIQVHTTGGLSSTCSHVLVSVVLLL